jgi:hypothetical protein
MGDCRRWFLSPDGNLWLIPWEALPLPDGTYAIEKHRIHYLVSGRDLVSDAARSHRHSAPPLVMADPDFDLRLKEASAETQRLLPEHEERTADHAQQRVARLHESAERQRRRERRFGQGRTIQWDQHVTARGCNRPVGCLVAGPDQQQRHGGGPQQRIGDAAQPGTGHPTPAMRGQHDQVRLGRGERLMA